MPDGHKQPGDFTQLFSNGMKRSIPRWDPCVGGRHVNLGAGNSPIKGCDNLEPPEWNAPTLPYRDGSVAVIHSYHFLEHLNSVTLAQQMRECERVLREGGKMFICVPYAMAPIAYMDPFHQTFWTEESMDVLLGKKGGYDTGHWRFNIDLRMIAGIDSQNLGVFYVLTKN